MKNTIITQFKKKKYFLITVLLFTVLVSCTNKSNGEETMSEAALIKAAEEMDSLFITAFNNGDIDAMMKLYWNSPDLRAYFPSDYQLQGYEAVKANFLKEFEANRGAKLEYTDVNNMPFDKGVVGYGTFKITMPVEGAAPMVFEGRYTEVKAMKDGKMVIVIDHASMPLSTSDENKQSN